MTQIHQESTPKPYFFRCSGTLVYSEPGNPYETIEVYLDFEPEFMVVKSWISEHGPDGCSSWHGLFLDKENQEKLALVAGGDLREFLQTYLKEHSNGGLSDLSQFLREQGITYASKYAF